MSSAAAIGPDPVRVSPLIRVGRYTFLTLGITYGIMRHRYLAKKEAARKAKREIERPAWEAARKAKLDAARDAEMSYLARECGIRVPPN